jgi:hypothetical protein
MRDLNEGSPEVADHDGKLPGTIADGDWLKSPAHVLIENRTGYREINQIFPKSGHVIWYTLSPGLLEWLSSRGEKVRSLEENVEQSRLNELGYLSFAFTEEATEHIDRVCRWSEDLHPGKALTKALQQFFFISAHRIYLLKEFFGYVGKEKGVIAGSRALKPVRQFHIRVGRFDTLFFAIAGEGNLPDNIVLRETRAEQEEDFIQSIDDLGRSRAEQIFRVINTNASVWSYKLWRHFINGKAIRIPIGTRKSNCVGILRPCELIEETLLPLLLKGARVVHLSIPNSGKAAPYEEREELFNSLVQMAKSKMGSVFGEHEDLVQAGSEILAQRTTRALEFFRGNLWQLKNLGERIKQTGVDCILSNTTSLPMGQVFMQWLRNRSIRVHLAEHSVTAGLSTLTYVKRDTNLMFDGDSIICYNPCARRFYMGAERVDAEHILVSGAPKQMTRIRFKGFQRSLARACLRIPSGSYVTGFICPAYLNNGMYGPHRFTNLRVHHLLKLVIRELLPNVDGYHVVKLYPTYQFPEPDPFLTPPNERIRVVQFFEFRYLRALFNRVIVASSFSTLGWAWSCDTPLIHLDLPENELVKDVKNELDKAIFRIDCGDPQWPRELERLLQMPKEEFLDLWEQKSEERKRITEWYILGNGEDPGKSVADHVLREA